MAQPIDNTDDIIDSRDVIERIDELVNQDDELTEDEHDELVSLRALHDEAADYSEDWEYGVALIRDSYFKTYAQELADDIGAIDAKASWPLSCIDWDQAAAELQMDYTAVDFDSVTYWTR